MKKRKLKKENKRLKRQLHMASNLLADARHELFESANEKMVVVNALADVWRLDRDRLGQQSKQRLFTAITLLGGEIKP